MTSKITNFFKSVESVKSVKPTSCDEKVEIENQTIPLSDKSFLIVGSLPKEVIPSMEKLMELNPGEPDTVIMAGKSVLTPRFVAHYLRPYYYTGRLHEAKPLPETLRPLLDWANSQEFNNGSNYNQVLVNFYMNGHHYIGKHSDDERQLVQESSIFSASFGQKRTFRIRTKSDGSIVKDIEMNNGTYVVMCGKMQKEFTHEVTKVMGKKGEDLSP